MPDAELTALHRAIGELRQSVSTIRLRYGDTRAVRRIANDVERLNIDAGELSELPTAPRPRSAATAEQEVVVVPDSPYDPDLWRGADDEGVGGYHRHTY